MATTMFVKHKVSDYGKWKRVYDGLASVRDKMGVKSASVHRDANDQNTIIVMHHFGDMKAATAFTNSEDLKTAMMSGGVIGHPEFWFGEDVEQTAH